MNTTTNTPGYNCRLTIFFSTNKNGRRLARYKSHHNPFRTFPIALDKAELFVATGVADDARSLVNHEAIIASLGGAR